MTFFTSLTLLAHKTDRKQRQQDIAHQFETQLSGFCVHLKSIVQVVQLIFIHRLLYQELGSLQPQLIYKQWLNYSAVPSVL